jgi:GxxExxY protein
MPITSPIKFREVTRDQYHDLDHDIMAIVFRAHGEMGPLFSERIYGKEIQCRCREAGHDVVAEAPIRVEFRDFHKTYFMDLLVDDCIDYELKSVEKIHPAHRNQTLNYLFLSGLKYGKIVNMRPSRVEHEYVTTTLTREDRYDFKIDHDKWADIDADSAWLKRLMMDLIQDWGAFLDVGLFYDAICFFRGGKENAIGEIDIVKDGRHLGKQKAHLLNADVVFKITALQKNTWSYERHVKWFLRNTRMKAAQWINFARREVSFKTLTPG